MKIARTAEELRTVLASFQGSRGFVATMGYLHEGHLSLMRASVADNDHTVISIFVNPLQFGPTEDFEAYPRDEERDLSLAEDAGVDLAFIPSLEEMYPQGADTTVSVGRLAEVVEGAARPGHFDGVATVVTKLLNLVQPTKAYFGQKDAQQVAVIRQIVRDLSLPVQIIVRDTVREPDGLAQSSRNAYLRNADREKAPVLWRALRSGADELVRSKHPALAEKQMRATVEAVAGIELDYARVVDPDTFEAVSDGSRALLVIAARIGSTRLIDNLLIGSSEESTGAAGR